MSIKHGGLYETIRLLLKRSGSKVLRLIAEALYQRFCDPTRGVCYVRGERYEICQYIEAYLQLKI